MLLANGVVVVSRFPPIPFPLGGAAIRLHPASARARWSVTAVQSIFLPSITILFRAQIPREFLLSLGRFPSTPSNCPDNPRSREMLSLCLTHGSVRCVPSFTPPLYSMEILYTCFRGMTCTYLLVLSAWLACTPIYILKGRRKSVYL